MITLIAESKTMRSAETESKNINSLIHPEGEEVAAKVINNLLSMDISELAAEMKVSPTMAAKIIKLAYDFPDKSTGLRAIEAFTGVVFKALDYASLDAVAKKYIDGDVRIISSLYGWLRPDDIVKPYRMEYSAKLSPDDTAFSSYWRKDVTMQLVKTLQQSHSCDIINLLPGDAEKCIDKKLVKNFARIWKVDFKLIEGDSGLRTPSSGRLKELRGLLLREMALQNIRTPDELRNLVTPTFLPLGTPDYPDHILFAV